MKIPNKFNRMGISLTVDEALPPLTLQALEDNVVIKITTSYSDVVSDLQYRTSKNGDWLPYTMSDEISLPHAGDIVQFWNRNILLHNTTEFAKGFGFGNSTGKFKAYGDVQSLMNYSTDCHYFGLFFLFKSSPIVSAKGLVLTALTVGNYGYNNMFANCPNLIQPPSEIQALTIGSTCCSNMFGSDVNLTDIPIFGINTTSFGINSLEYMFKGCSKLKSAQLYINNFGNFCKEIFSGCSQLSQIKVKFTNWHNGASAWVNGVSSSGTFYKPSALPETYGTNYIPTGWTVVNID